RFEAEDLKVKYAAEFEKLELRKAMKLQFYELVQAKNGKWRAGKADRAALRDGYESDRDENFTITDELVETVIKTVEENA
ncbi:hypothetical protein T492DRAFT_876191, partial [Pavlovales sp. CCMP2436]